MQDNQAKPITAYRQQLHERIIMTAMRSFAARGIRAVKMDDIAHELSISKRTVYELYTNKEQLLYEGVRRFQQIHEQQMQELVEQGKSVMDIVLEAYRHQVEDMKSVSPQFYDDLKKYPHVLKLIESHNRHNRKSIIDFMQRGVSEGYFRSDLNYDIVVLMFDAIGQAIMAGKLYRRFDMEQIFKSMVFTSLRGICTSMGAAVLEKEL